MSVILVGTDFSPRSDRALRRALLLTRQTGFELLIAGIVEERETTGQEDARRGEAAQMLRQMQQTFAGEDGVACRIEVAAGEPAPELARIAREAGAALMVIGPHQRSPIGDAFGAITAERIARAAPVPLICANGVPAGRYRRILLPVDLGAAAHRAAEAVKSVGFAADDGIALVHFYDPHAREMLSRAGVPAEDRRAYLAECADAAREDLRAFARAVGLEQAIRRVRQDRGRTSADIAQLAAEEGADLIVVSPSDKGVIGRSILGSVTEDLIRSATRDILVIPASPAG